MTERFGHGDVIAMVGISARRATIGPASGIIMPMYRIGPLGLDLCKTQNAKRANSGITNEINAVQFLAAAILEGNRSTGPISPITLSSHEILKMLSP
jgi:hypothetical protein